MFGSKTFQWLSGNYHNLSVKTTELPITEADADSATGLLQRGKLVNYKANDLTELAFTTGMAIGMITRNINKLGLNTDEGYKNFSIGLTDLPLRRGLAVTVRRPAPGSQAIFEGLGVASVDNLVVTSGTGALASGTARNSELSVIKGGLYLAQTGDFVIALLDQANLTPITGGNLRIRVQFVSPYKKP
jgi:hypothetical protein